MTLDDIIDRIHYDRPNLVTSILMKDGQTIVFFDKDGLSRGTLQLKKDPFGSITVDYFDFDHKLPAKETT